MSTCTGRGNRRVLSVGHRREKRRAQGLPSRRLVRYADDFVVLVHGTRQGTEALREEIAGVLAPMGLRLSQAKTQVVHLSEGFDFLGFHIQWRRKRGTSKWYVYTFISTRALRLVKQLVRIACPGSSFRSGHRAAGGERPVGPVEDDRRVPEQMLLLG
jgi:Reverse transcriptase (RNA-dependent DNA polymerase)